MIRNSSGFLQKKFELNFKVNAVFPVTAMVTYLLTLRVEGQKCIFRGPKENLYFEEDWYPSVSFPCTYGMMMMMMMMMMIIIIIIIIITSETGKSNLQLFYTI